MSDNKKSVEKATTKPKKDGVLTNVEKLAKVKETKVVSVHEIVTNPVPVSTKK